MSIYRNALESLFPSAGFGDSTCTDAGIVADSSDTQVEVMTLILVPLGDLSAYDDDTVSILQHVSTIVTEAVSDGSFEARIRQLAPGTEMASIIVQVVSADT